MFTTTQHMERQVSGGEPRRNSEQKPNAMHEKKFSPIFNRRQQRERQWSTGADPQAKCSLSNALDYYYSTLPPHTESQGPGGAAPAERIKFNCSL